MRKTLKVYGQEAVSVAILSDGETDACPFSPFFQATAVTLAIHWWVSLGICSLN